MKAEAVLFDFDDTIGQRSAYAYACYRYALEQAAGDLDPMKKETILQHCMILDQAGDVNKAYVREGILARWGVDLGENFNTWWEDNLWRFTVLMPDARPVLETLRQRGYKTGLVTNGNAAGQRGKIRKTQVADLFSVILISDEEGIAKPDPRLYQRAAERLGVSCEACAFVGDLFETDLFGAYQAGMRPVWMNSHGLTCCDYAGITVIHSLKELLKLFP